MNLQLASLTFRLDLVKIFSGSTPAYSNCKYRRIICEINVYVSFVFSFILSYLHLTDAKSERGIKRNKKIAFQ